MVKGIDRVLFDEAAIAKRVKLLGAEISKDYKDKNPLLIGILKGSFVFLSDLSRAIDIPCEFDFMVARSYGKRTESSGVVEILKDVYTDIKGRDCLIVEDILESANTLYSVCEVLKSRSPASVKVCVFLSKDIKRVVPFEADYKCFDVGNEFIVGYGLDYDEKYRNLPYVGVLEV